MAKQVLHIKQFEGGINKKSDPRDIEENQLVEATNVNLSNGGRIKSSGDGKAPYVTVNANNVVVSPTNNIVDQTRNTNETPISSGYGLFSFAHDYNFNNTNTTTEPEKISTEFICINDGADIDIWTDIPRGSIHWGDSLISMGTTHNTGTSNEGDYSLSALTCVKPIYYKADNGLRVCDANFGEEIVAGAMVGSIHLSVNGTSLTTDIDMFSSNDVNSYIKIDSEVMQITAYSRGTGSGGNDVLTIKRARFGTVSAYHHSPSDGSKSITRLNVPKIFSHINRPILKKAGANVSINRWLQDIQVPEAPEYRALTVFASNVLGYNGTNLTSTGLYPSEPEKVILGVSLATDEVDASLRFHKDDTVTSDTTSTETVVTITLASEADNTTEENVTSSKYNFAIGKFISISGAGDDESNGIFLNGIHEIVGFGTGIGEVKIAADADAVGYTQTGEEVVILEDELIDDNLKNKYIYGMSYLYDGGGSELQESKITTGVTNNTPNLIFPDSRFPEIGGSDPKWRVIDGSGANMTGSPSDLDASGTHGFYWKGPGVVSYGLTGPDWLFYETGTSGTVAANTEYYISGTVTLNGKEEGGTAGEDDDIKIYVGIGPGQLTAGGTPVIVAAPSDGFTGTINFAGIATSHSSVDSSVPVAIWFEDYGGGVGENATFHSIYVTKKSLAIMSHTNSFDFRQVQDVSKGYLSFLCNNSRTGNYGETTQYNSWNERIEGFRIYMKQVDIIGGGLADEWLLLYDVNITEGTYVMHAKDSEEEILRLGDIASNDWDATNTTDAKAIVTNNVAGDSIKNVPVMTYESENHYKADTNLAVRYKAVAIVNRSVYIGNLKIGDKTFPDRMLKSPTDKFDSFPDDGTHFIDVATSDGQSIVALESIGNKLIQFKEKTAYLITPTSEGEELEDTWFGAGVKNPCQITKASNGIFWVNSDGIYYYDGTELKNVSSDKFRVDNWLTNEDFNKPVIVGYDKKSNKLIILTTNVSGKESGGYIYDINIGAITEHNNIFNWYHLTNPTDLINGNTETEI